MGESLKETIPVQGITCTNCAAKIERTVSGRAEIESCQIDFATGRMVLKWNDVSQREHALDEIAATVARIEPGAKLVMGEKAHHEHTHEHTHDAATQVTLIRFLVGASLLAVAWTTDVFVLFLLAYVVVGYDVVYGAARNIWHREWFDEKFLMVVATLGAFSIREYPEAVGVMLFYQLGEYFQGRAVFASRRSIQTLLAEKPTLARLVTEHAEIELLPERVKVGQYIVVLPGEKIPLDGVVLDGVSSLNTSSLTGESLPRDVRVGDEVLAGTLNLERRLLIEVSRPAAESSLQKMIELVEEASQNKAKTEQLMTRLARVYTPVVVFAALGIAVIPPLFVGGFEEWLYRALIFLVISCPCALVISIPLGYFGGIGAASRNGILVKGGQFLDLLAQAKQVVFDKTGTLTTGVFTVESVRAQSGDEKELLVLAARMEASSTHPIAQAIVRSAPSVEPFKNVKEVPGYGLEAIDGTDHLHAGNERYMRQLGVEIPEEQMEGTSVHLSRNGHWLGQIMLADLPKEETKAVIDEFKTRGVHTTVLSGDAQPVVSRVARGLGIERYAGELLPHQKVEHLEKLLPEGPVAFVGDGLNDAAALARADVGIVMGGIGSDAAIDAADVVLMKDSPADLVRAIDIAKQTRRIIWQNITLAFAMKGIFLLLGAFGMATMWEAVFADVGVALLAIANASRLIHKFD